MYIITQTSLFDNEEIEILGDLERNTNIII